MENTLRSSHIGKVLVRDIVSMTEVKSGLHDVQLKSDIGKISMFVWLGSGLMIY